MQVAVYGVLVLVIWVSLGVSTVIYFFARHGRRSSLWYVVGVVLGPMLIPIAAEMERRSDRLRRWTVDGSSRQESPNGWVMVGAVDGSPESDASLREVGRMWAGSGAQVVLLTVLDPDGAGPEEESAAQDLLNERASWLEAATATVECEVDTGDPVQVILETAASRHADLLFLGRRGRGLSHRLLGSVATQIVKRADVPVLLAAPVNGVTGPMS